MLFTHIVIELSHHHVPTTTHQHKLTSNTKGWEGLARGDCKSVNPSPGTRWNFELRGTARGPCGRLLSTTMNRGPSLLAPPPPLRLLLLPLLLALRLDPFTPFVARPRPLPCPLLSLWLRVESSVASSELLPPLSLIRVVVVVLCLPRFFSARISLVTVARAAGS